MVFRMFMILIVASAADSLAQNGACQTTEVPVSVINSKAELLRGLNLVDFSAHSGRQGLEIKSLQFDESPKRMVLVLDQGKALSNAARKAEDIIVQTIVQSAQDKEQIALISARGAEHTVRLGEPRNAYIEAAVSASSGDGRALGGVLDSVMQAFELLGEPMPGDAIIVIARDLKGSRKTNAERVASLLSARNTRLFGLALGPVMTKNLSLSAGPGDLPYAGPGPYEAGDEDFYFLARNSGGVVLGVVDFNSKLSPGINDAAFQPWVREKARTVLDMAAGYYRLTLEPPAARVWRLDLSELVRKSIPGISLLYPHQLPPCRQKSQ
jgi:hypothetical protein